MAQQLILHEAVCPFYERCHLIRLFSLSLILPVHRIKDTEGEPIYDTDSDCSDETTDGEPSYTDGQAQEWNLRDAINRQRLEDQVEQISHCKSWNIVYCMLSLGNRTIIRKLLRENAWKCHRGSLFSIVF